LAAVAAGRQAAFIAPTEILARQHFYKIKQYLHASRVRLALLTGSLPATERDQTRAALADGAIDIVVGTHALLRHDTHFARLAFVVIDEQHRFGVHQRVLARGQRGLPHLLVMSATPIPRTLALTFFGHLDVSVLDESPPGRGRVHTDIVKPDNWPALLDRLRPKLAAGERAYIVCPRIGQRPSTSPLRGAQQVYEELTQKHWRDLNVGLVHGQQAADENAATLQAFADGKLHALVATSMIEVGVDVPAATTMIIEHAERFGLAQLHQLRGRIGRGERDSHCYLVARADADAAQTRLSKLCETTDGFAIAEADLALRGPGEVLGARQHGLPELRFADLSQDLPLLRQARADAAEIVRDDPGLTQPAHQHLRGWLKRRFRGRFKLIDAA
jgi:ATP-dependent DNA helicase RecG